MPSRFRAYLFSVSALIFFAILAALIARSLTASAAPKEEMTPLLLSVQDAPIPFTGSDSSTHLAYELLLTNFSSGDVTLEKVEILADGVRTTNPRCQRNRHSSPANRHARTNLHPRQKHASPPLHPSSTARR